MAPGVIDPNRAAVNVYIPKVLKAEVVAKAKLEGVTITDVVEHLLTDWVLGQTSLDAYRNPEAID